MYDNSVPALMSKNVGNTLTNYKVWGGIIFNVKDVGKAKGDGIADDTAAIQATLDAASAAGGGIVRVLNGTYKISTSLTIKSNVILEGSGVASIIKASSAFPASSAMVANLTRTGTVDNYYDSNMVIRDLVFDGNNNAGRTAELISFVKCKNILIERVAVQNCSYIGIALGGNRNVTVQNCYFTNTGNPVVTAEGGAAIWVDHTGDGSANKDITIDKCYFIQLNWSGVYFAPTGGTISNCTFRLCGESSIFSNNNANRVSYVNNKIYYSTRKNISACGIEVGGALLQILGNHIEGCGNSGISLMDSKQILVDDNTLINNGQEGTYYSTSSGISLLSHSASPNQPDHIKISNNRIYDQQSPMTQIYGIDVAMSGAGTTISNLIINDNDLQGNKLQAIRYQAGVIGSGCSMRGNLGDASNYPKAGQFQGPAANGIVTITGVGFIPRYIEFVAVDASTTRALSSIAFVTAAASVDVVQASGASVSSGWIASRAVDVRDQAGTLLCQATLLSFDQDGFRLNFTTTALQAWINYIAHP